MASWTTPDLSRLPRRPLDLPDVRSGGRRGPRAALRHRRGVAPPGQGLRRGLGAGAPSARCGRRRRPPRPRARRAGRVREARQRARWSTMLWRMTARASLETRRNGRAGIPRRGSPQWWGRSVDEVDAVTLPAPRRRPRPACDPRAPSADVRRCRTSSRSRSPARPRTGRPTRTDTQLRTSATAGRAPRAPPALFFGSCAAVRGVPIALCRGYVTSHCDRICRDRISRAPRAAERLRSETEHDAGGDVPSVFSAVVELVEPLLDAEHAVHEGGRLRRLPSPCSTVT